MARVATDTILLGLHGEIHAGEEIPASYRDIQGEHETDFDRLEQLGLVEDEKPARKGPKAADK